MTSKQVLSVLGIGCTMVMMLPLCALCFMILAGTTTMADNSYNWTGDDTAALTTFAVLFTCVLGIIIMVGGISAWGLLSKNDK